MNSRFTAFVIILLSVCAVVFSSCSGEKIEGDHYSTDISGKWKLIAASYWDQEQIRRYYNQNKIIYNFNPNNILTVSGETANINDYRGHKTGKYSYQTLPIPVGPNLSLRQIHIGDETLELAFDWVFYAFYEGPAMHLYSPEETLVLISVD